VWEETVIALFEVFSQYLLGGTKKRHRRPKDSLSLGKDLKVLFADHEV
jgi:hypothetical protein